MLADLRTYVLASGAVSSLIGSRFYPSTVPQSPTFPLATYMVISSGRELQMDGPDGLVRDRIQIDAWAQGFGQARDTADAIRGRLHGFSGAMGGSTNVQSIGFDNERTMYETSSDVGSTLISLHRISMDFSIWYEE